MSTTTDVLGGVKNFLLDHGQVKHLISIFMPSPKKGDVAECTHNCTIALFPDANTPLEVIQKLLDSYIGYETTMKQAGLIERWGARDQIANVGE